MSVGAVNRSAGVTGVQVLGWGFGQPDVVSSDGTHVWVANGGGKSVTELSASTGALLQVIKGSSYGFDAPLAISSDGTDVWVANSHSVTEMSASKGALVQVISGHKFGFDYPRAISSDGTDVWVANSEAGSVTVFPT